MILRALLKKSSKVENIELGERSMDMFSRIFRDDWGKEEGKLKDEDEKIGFSLDSVVGRGWKRFFLWATCCYHIEFILMISLRGNGYFV